MSFASNLNFFSTVVSFGCVSFAASNFGIKFGRAITFINPSGYDYISKSNYPDKIYDAIVKEAEKDANAPDWAKNKVKLRRWCEKHQRKARKWEETSKYCLIKNNVRHQLLNKGFELKFEKEGTATANGGTTTTGTAKENPGCTEDVFESYADSTGNSVGYLFAVAKCATPPKTEEAPAGSAGSAGK